jgi:hypothetical protein
MTRWNLQAVEKAAPDAASLAAGRKLASPGPWSETGSTETLLWGRCQGSGKTPYQVSIDLTGPAYRCSCPSRKFPCKHAIALLLLWVQGSGSVAEVAESADFAREWAEQRADRAAGSAARKASTAPPDPEARAKRLEERLALMSSGIEEFSLWLADLVRGGTVQARRQPWGWWDAAAARLVDAQLPGLAERVRTMGSDIHQRDDWADHLLAEAGRWWTVTRAWQRRDELDERSRADLRTCVGWAVPSEEVREADAVTDRWLVLGAHRSDDGRLQQQRTWLRGESSGETVQVLDFAARVAPLPAARIVGSVLEATVARYPGSAPRRALFATEPVVVGTASGLPTGADVDGARAILATVWSQNPWAVRAPIVLREASLVPAGGAVAAVRDASGRSLPLLTDGAPWPLLAVTGGRPADVFGEVEEAGFRPLSVAVGGEVLSA